MSAVPPPSPTRTGMTRNDVLDFLRAHKAELARRFGVGDIALFGSFSRDEAKEDSDIDIDILVRFDRPATIRSFFGAQFYLEDRLGRRVDLVTHRALRSEFRPYVEAEAIHVVEHMDGEEGGP